MKLRISLLVCVILLLGIAPVSAQSSLPPIPAAPPDDIYVFDELDWLTSEQEASINSTILRLDQDELAEIAVVTLNDCGSDKFAFRKSLFDKWGIGHVNDNDGLLILVCWYDGDQSRRSVEQLYGPGLNAVLTPTKTDQIAQESFVPAFKEDKPGAGLVAMVRSYNGLLRTPRRANNAFETIAQFFMRLPEIIQLGLGLLLILGLQWVLGRFLPASWRERWLKDSGNDGGGFDGGSSSGGGGSSTRF